MQPIDPEILGEWFECYGAGLALYARQWLDANEAEDVVQEAFIRLMRQNTMPHNVKSWLYALVRNEAISRLRRQQRRQHHEPEVVRLQTEWFEHSGHDQVDAQLAQQALTTLPEELREIVVLRIWSQMTLKDIGELLAQPVSTVFNKYQAAMASLRKKIEKSCQPNTNSIPPNRN